MEEGFLGAWNRVITSLTPDCVLLAMFALKPLSDHKETVVKA